MDSSESNHTPRSRTVSQLRTTDDPTGSDRYAVSILDGVLQVPNQMNSVFVGLSCRRCEARLLQVVDTSSEINSNY